MRVLIVLLVTLALAAAKSKSHQRIVGGSITNINQYPEIVALLWSWGTTGHLQDCGGTILTHRAVLTAAHCTINDPAHRWRSRVGSTYSNWGGVVHSTSHIINHPQYNPATFDHDIAIVRTSSNINLNNVARAGNIAGSNYFLGDNQVVWAAGWGTQYSGGQLTDTLRHVQVWTVNQAVCRNRYAELRLTITDNMLCSGWLDVGGRDQCQGDSGGPLYHNRVVVGVTSWGYGCAHPRYPGVNARVTRYTAWIQANA